MATETRDAGCCCGETCSFYCGGSEATPGILYWLVNAPDPGTYTSHCTPANGLVISCAGPSTNGDGGCQWDGTSDFWTSPASTNRLKMAVRLWSAADGMHAGFTVTEFLADETTIVDTIGNPDIGALPTSCNPLTVTYPQVNAFSSRGTDVACQIGGSIYE